MLCMTQPQKTRSADYKSYESYCFTGDEYDKLKMFLEISDQTIEITPESVAY